MNHTGRVRTLAIDEHVAGPTKVPAHERDVSQRFLGDDPQLVWERPEEDRDVVDALMVCDEHVGASGLQALESACSDAYTRCGQNQTRPRARAPVREISVAIEKTRHERQRAEHDRVDRNARDQKENRAPPVKRRHVLLARGSGGWRDRRTGAGGRRWRRGRLRGGGRLDESSEDHLPGRGLQHARHDHVDGLADHLARIIHDDHRPVVEIGDALVVFLPFLEDEYLHDLARQHDRLERIGELVDIQHLDAAQLRNFVQVEIVGDDLALQRTRQLDQLQIDFAHVREVHVGDGDFHARHLLDLLQNIEPAPSAIALHRIRRIRHELQLFQNELRDHDGSVHETGFADVGDAAVDDDARVEDLVTLARTRRTEQRDEVLRFQPFAATSPKHQTQIWEREQDETVQEHHALVAEIRPVECGADCPRGEQTDGAAEQGTESHVEEGRVRAEGLELKCRITNRRYEQNTRECEPRHCELPGAAGDERDVYESVNLRTAEPENQAISSSSASPTVRTPTSSILPSPEPSRLAAGRTIRVNPICAASRTRSAACGMPLISPLKPTSPQSAVDGARLRLRTLDATAATTLRSAAGSSIVMPAAIFAYTASPPRPSPA